MSVCEHLLQRTRWAGELAVTRSCASAARRWPMILTPQLLGAHQPPAGAAAATHKGSSPKQHPCCHARVAMARHSACSRCNHAPSWKAPTRAAGPHPKRHPIPPVPVPTPQPPNASPVHPAPRTPPSTPPYPPPHLTCPPRTPRRTPRRTHPALRPPRPPPPPSPSHAPQHRPRRWQPRAHRTAAAAAAPGGGP